MGKPTVQLPDPPDTWDINPSTIPGLDQNPSDTGAASAGGWPDYILPDGSRLGTVIQQQRAALQNSMAQAQNDPQVTDGGLGNAFGQYLAVVQPNGPMDFKNRFGGQDGTTEAALGKAGNFALYAIGSGIFPDTAMDGLATAYNLYKTGRAIWKGRPTDGSNPFGPDKSAQSVRDQALAYGAGL
jgi:hypothetical protein